MKMYKQLKIDIFNIKAPVIEQEIKPIEKRKRDNKVEVSRGYAQVISKEQIVFESKKEDIEEIEIKF